MAFIKYSYDDKSNTCMFLLNGKYPLEGATTLKLTVKGLFVSICR